MNREEQLLQLSNCDQWDFIVIGGGASGLGAAVDATSRGFKTVLFEGVDFAKGTSSRSTKLVHGGVRYLAQGDIGLVREALKERGFGSKRWSSFSESGVRHSNLFASTEMVLWDRT